MGEVRIGRGGGEGEGEGCKGALTRGGIVSTYTKLYVRRITNI